MRLLVTALAATARPTGLGVYAAMVGARIARLDGRAVVAAWSPSPLDSVSAVRAGSPPRTGGVGAPIQRLSWLARRLDREAERCGATAVLHLLPEIGRTTRPQVIVAHDLAPLVVPTSLLQRAYFETVVRYSTRMAVGVIAVSKRVAGDLTRLLGVPPERIAVVPEGVDLDAFHPSRRVEPARPYLIAVGIHAHNKRLDLLIGAFAASRLAATHELHLVGPFDRRYTPGLRALARASGAAAAISFREYASWPELAILYASADAYVCASRYEGFCLPGLEALACGTPVVATDVGSLREYGGDAAAIVPRDAEVDELANAMERVVRAVNDTPTLRAVARGRAELYPWDSTAVALVRAADELSASSIAGATTHPS